MEDHRLISCITLGLLTGLALSLPGRRGEFSPAVSYTAGSEPYSVASGDFNGDGIKDLAVANFASNTISILLGQGNGVFQSPVSYTVGPYPSSVAVGDFNGDGFLDLAVTNTNDFLAGGSVSILLGNGDGTFGTATDYPHTSGSPFFVIVSDLNGDGALDLAVANHNGGLGVYLGNGDGTFQTGVNYDAGTNPQSVTVGDFNGDGKPDLAVANAYEHTHGLLHAGPTSIADGGQRDPDSNASNSVSIFLGNGDGTFQTAVNYPAGDGPSGVAAGDFNGDGALDLAVADRTGNTVSILIGNGDGTFQLPVSYAANLGPVGLSVADVNGDSKLDIVTCALTAGSVDVLLGNGDGTFQSAIAYPAGTEARIVAVADLNFGGAPDLAVADAGGGVDVLLNNGGTALATTSSANPSKFGQAVTFTTKVSASIPGAGNPAGTVFFADGSTPLGNSEISRGQASLTTSTLSIGTHTIRAFYSGDRNFNPHSAPALTQVVQQR